MWSEAVLDWCCTECQTRWGRPSGWKVLGCVEHFPAPGALKGAELPVSGCALVTSDKTDPLGYPTHRPLLWEEGGSQGSRPMGRWVGLQLLLHIVPGPYSLLFHE